MFSGASVSQDSTTFTVTATSTRDLSTGWFVLGIVVYEEGADPGDPVTSGVGFAEEVSGAVSSQSITIAKADYAMGASSFANIRIGYCPDTVFNPATVVWSTVAILPIVQSASISGTATDGQTLTAGHGNIIGSYPITPSYVWRQCDAAGASCANEGGVASTLLLDAGNVGSTIRQVTTATNSAGAGSATSSATAVVASLGRSDNFNRANGAVGTPSDGGSAWIVTGNLVVSSNKLAQGAGGDNRGVLEASDADVDVTVTITSSSFDGGGGVIIRRDAADATDYVLVSIGSASQIVIYTAPAFDFVAQNNALTLVSGDVIRVNTNGAAITVYQNGVLRISTTSSYNQTDTKHGLRISSSADTFDDFSIA